MAEQYLTKGSKIFVETTVDITKHEDKYYTNFNVTSMEFLSSSKQSADSTETTMASGTI